MSLPFCFLADWLNCCDAESLSHFDFFTTFFAGKMLFVIAHRIAFDSGEVLKALRAAVGAKFTKTALTNFIAQQGDNFFIPPFSSDFLE